MNANESIRLMNGRRMQCKDIPDEKFLDAVRSTARGAYPPTTTGYAVRDVLEQYLGHIPFNLLQAKARRLIQRGLIDGCGCGCRGDFSIPDECRDDATRGAPPSSGDGAPETAPPPARPVLPAGWPQYPYPWWIRQA